MSLYSQSLGYDTAGCVIMYKKTSMTDVTCNMCCAFITYGYLTKGMVFMYIVQGHSRDTCHLNGHFPCEPLD